MKAEAQRMIEEHHIHEECGVFGMYDFDGNDRVVDTTIKRLRKSLGDAGDQIKTSIGRGYKIL